VREGTAGAHPELPVAVGAGAISENRLVVGLSYLDIVVVIVATPIAIALGAATFGWLMGAGGWILQRSVQALDKRWIGTRFTEPRQQLAASLAEAFARIWLLAGAIIIAGTVGTRHDGLTAALVILGAYSVAFVIRITVTGPRQARTRG
jgi:hypothetical protein